MLRGRALETLALILTAVFVQSRATGQVVGGGGSAITDCLVTYDSKPAPNTPSSNPKNLKCADQAVDCDGQGNGDGDARFGYCNFQVRLALNTVDAVRFPLCSPANLQGFAIPYSTVLDANNDTHPKNIADFDPLANFVASQLPLDNMMTNVVSAFKSVTIPMRIGFTSKGPIFKTTVRKLHPTMCEDDLLQIGSNPNKFKCPSGVPKDVDTFKLTCTPPLDSMGQPISACTSAAGTAFSGTFQQIQEHIFNRKCSTQAMCHGSAGGLHDLCLNSACNGSADDPYTNLVGHIPHDFNASQDLLLRVDAGNPANSLLVHKINGGTQLIGTMATYGFRMPYNDPASDRARPKLSSAEIQLITDWIQNGALQTGFQSTAKGACQ